MRSPRDSAAVREIAARAFSRAAGAPLVPGNAVRILRDAAENYPAWEAAIRNARHRIHIEMYIVHDDSTGHRFRDLLVERARAGARVRVLYDWLGSWKTRSRFYRPLSEAGAEVRAMNPPRLDNFAIWTRRDHRKLITIDGAIAYIGGLCIGAEWEGHPERNIPPWRDTGLEIRGPAVADAERAFLDNWAAAGGKLEEPLPVEAQPSAGDVAVRVIATVPATANMLALDLLVASLARRSLWITDAYFIASTAYMQALQRAAADGVDVRLLLPAASDLTWVAAVSRTQYRPLLEAGVRVFEWNGSMLHAKTAVADSLWTRIGSTNLNVASWFGNWEMDVGIEHREIAARMEALFEDDLCGATEVVLNERRQFGGDRPRVTLAQERRRARGGRLRGARTASARRLIGGEIRLRAGLQAAVSGHRQLEEYERKPVVFAGLALLGVAAVGFWAPRTVAFSVASFCALLAVYLFARAVGRGLRRERGDGG